MANPEHLNILKQGVKAWNAWRKKNPTVRPKLTEADLSGANLSEANLSKADLSKADLSKADLSGANLFEANLLIANLLIANLSRADLTGANLTSTRLWQTVFGQTVLTDTQGLHQCNHLGPSYLDYQTLALNKHLPREFLLGCGLPPKWVDYLPSLLTDDAIQFYSCFISYSTKDEAFATRLLARMRQENLRVWVDSHNIQGGKKVHEQLEEAIQVHEKFLLVLSKHSMTSNWVAHEVRQTRALEVKEKKRKLFPIRLTTFDEVKKWKLFDADTGQDLAVEVREYHIPDFSTWKDNDAFEAVFAKLLEALKKEGKPVGVKA